MYIYIFISLSIYIYNWLLVQNVADLTNLDFMWLGHVFKAGTSSFSDQEWRNYAASLQQMRRRWGSSVQLWPPLELWRVMMTLTALISSGCLAACFERLARFCHRCRVWAKGFPKKQGGPESPKARRHIAHLCLKQIYVILHWCAQLCSARNRRKIFIDISWTLMVSRATIHHSMLRQLRLHSFSRYFC